MIDYFPESDSRRALDRKPVGTRADRWKCYGPEPFLLCPGQGFPVATRQQFILIVFPVPPDRSDRMDNIPGAQVIASGDFRISCRAAVESSTLFEQVGPRASVNRAIDSSASQERGISGIDDCVDLLTGYVPLSDLDSVFHDVPSNFRAIIP